jgi:hypothetical protein
MVIVIVITIRKHIIIIFLFKFISTIHIVYIIITT